jgi:hypothetical protein
MYNEMTCFDCHFLVINHNDVCFCARKESLVAWNDDACEMFQQIGIEPQPENLIPILAGNIVFYMPEFFLQKPRRSQVMTYIAKYADTVRATGWGESKFILAYDEQYGFYAY